ncbi:hypothetical protein G6M87_03905 [Rhizobium rhizogenes]|uniref:hypothetical protein n=1 Tax=Rhizobium TaxID=379 RepID=UPI00026EE060|nr:MULTISPECIES: hypothetical protein [Rhizobium]EJK82897.1 hypothetical protein PMI03_03470 [Rhizobium sp. AP16]NTI21008.1 hypothetical protein [Rhizobium rhizogenes]QTG04647.1 hypothetical protein G6M87_03905 [Rhizobium rhizogenes]
MNRKILAAIVLLPLAACAKRPDAIVPTDIPMAAYSNLNCPELTTELLKEQNNLASLSKQQNSAATGDAVGVFLIGVPASSLTGGDKEGVISVSKGKVLAIQNTMKAKGCK